jgi:DnaJ-class molecular chaperone
MNFYEILGIPHTSSQEEIRKAYRQKAMEYHPDRNPGNPNAAKHFIEIQDAYESLSNPAYKPTVHKPAPRPRNPNNWIKDAPPPTHDIWGNPINGHVEPKRRERPKPSPKTQVQKYEPEVDLWKSLETKETKFHNSYWKEYNRLKKEMAYDEVDKFWDALESWSRKNR